MSKAKPARSLAAIRGRAILAVLASMVCAAAAAKESSHDDLLARAKAMTETAGLACTVQDAQRATPLLLGGGGGRGGGRRGGGGSMSQDDRTRPSYYEVACAEGMGFIFVLPPRPRPAGDQKDQDAGVDRAQAEAPNYLNCLEAKEAADKARFPVECRLKGDKDPLPVLQAAAAKAGLDCQIKAARGLGHVDDRSFFEIACRNPPAMVGKTADAAGFILVTDRSVQADKAAGALSCFDTWTNPGLKCAFTPVGPVIDALHRYLGKAAPACAPTGQRLAGLSPAGEQVFEIRCGNGDGYLARRTARQTFDGLVGCTDAAAGKSCHLENSTPRS